MPPDDGRFVSAMFANTLISACSIISFLGRFIFSEIRSLPLHDVDSRAV